MTNTIFALEAKAALEKTTPLQRFTMKRWGRKLYLGNEHREGWSGSASFYLFWCETCDHYAKDYPHGFPGRQYIYCSYCGARHDFAPWWAGLTVLFQR